MIDEKFINKITRFLNKKVREDLYDIYKRNEDFSEDLVKYIRDKLAQSNEQILDKRYNYFIFLISCAMIF